MNFPSYMLPSKLLVKIWISKSLNSEGTSSYKLADNIYHIGNVWEMVTTKAASKLFLLGHHAGVSDETW